MAQAPQTQVDLSPFREALIKRKAQYSTVIVFKCDDIKRLDPFIAYASMVLKNPTIFLYKVWEGLFRVTVAPAPSGEISYEPVYLQPSSQASPLTQVAMSGFRQRIRSLETALQYLDQVMERQRNVLAIFWGLFAYGQVSQQELYNFVKFLRSVIFDDRYYVAGHTIVVFSGAPETIIDEDTLRHCIYVPIQPSSDEERRALLQKIAEQLGLQITPSELNVLVEATRGLTLHETESIAVESIYKYQRLDTKIITDYKYDLIRKSELVEIVEPEHGFEAVGGYRAVKSFLIRRLIIPLRFQELTKRLGLRPPRGILFFGPPGTGKTWLAMALAKELNLPFLRVSAANIVSKWYGETTKNVKRIIELTERIAPCVLFIDEIDQLGRRGHITEHEESRRAFGVLLQWLGDPKRKTIVIGATNRPEDLDEAFRRVGRFDYIIPILYPDLEARYEILKVHTQVVKKVPLAEDVDLWEIAERTELWNCGELEELVVTAASIANERYIEEATGKRIDDEMELLKLVKSGSLDSKIKKLAEQAVVTMEDFRKALQRKRINYDERRQQLERYLRLAEEFCNDEVFLQQLREMYQPKKSRIEAVKEELSI